MNSKTAASVSSWFRWPMPRLSRESTLPGSGSMDLPKFSFARKDRSRWVWEHLTRLEIRGSAGGVSPKYSRPLEEAIWASRVPCLNLGGMGDLLLWRKRFGSEVPTAGLGRIHLSLDTLSSEGMRMGSLEDATRVV